MKPLCNPLVVCQHAIKAPQEGAIIECGVYDGATTSALKSALGRRKIYAADTFEGMPYDGTGIEQAGGFVKGYLATVDKKKTIKTLEKKGIWPLVGLVEDTLPPLDKERFAFVFLDLDLEVPTRFAASFLMPRMLPEGIIGFHDYVERPGYCLGGIAKVVSEVITPNWEEVFRKGTKRDNRFIFFKKKVTDDTNSKVQPASP